MDDNNAMIIKLGSINATYPTRTYNDFMIFADVPDSQLSYESPKLVRDVTDLDIWFGKDFPQRSYYEELLGYDDVSLFLYKPLTEKSNSITDIWCEEVKRNYEYDKTERTYLFTNGGSLCYKDGDKYYLLDPSPGVVYKVNDGTEYTYDYGEYVRLSFTPEYHRNNRDTLQLGDIFSPCTYSCPKFNEEKIETYPFKAVNYPISYSGLDYSKLEKGYQTYAFNLSYTKDKLNPGEYLIITDQSGRRLYFHNNGKVDSTYYDEDISVTSVSSIISTLLRKGFRLDGNLLYSLFPCPTTYFYEIEGFSLDPNITESFNILSSGITKKSLAFWSKTIGTGGVDGGITVKVESPSFNTENRLNSLREKNPGEKEEALIKIVQDKFEEENPKLYYRVTLKRFDYEEVYEGYFNPDFGENSLEDIINKSSSLVNCIYLGEGQIPEGTWEMKGAVEITPTPESYKDSLDLLFEDESIHPDFFFIWDVKNYNRWTELVDKLKEKNSQALVHNTEKDYIENYTEDKDNRIIYFLNNIEVGYESRPGWYLYLRGLLEDVYSYSTSNIYYESPEGSVLYEDPLSKYEEKKCNYLSDNGHTYYYKKYFNGSSYNTTGWMRFAIGKISRELEKNKWSFLSQPITSKIQSSISQILSYVEGSFGIIRSISLAEYSTEPKEGRINLTINTSVADLVGNNITLDLTINFNK